MVKKAKKRGVKPGTKRGKYKRSRKPNKIIKGLNEALEAAKSDNEFTVTAILGNKIKVGDKVTFGDMPKYTPAPLTLCGQLEDAILLLETRVSNAIAKINSLM